jgi:hypothetical protein
MVKVEGISNMFGHKPDQRIEVRCPFEKCDKKYLPESIEVVNCNFIWCIAVLFAKEYFRVRL